MGNFDFHIYIKEFSKFEKKINSIETPQVHSLWPHCSSKDYLILGMINVLCVALVNASLAVEVYASSDLTSFFFVLLRCRRRHRRRRAAL